MRVPAISVLLLGLTNAPEENAEPPKQAASSNSSAYNIIAEKPTEAKGNVLSIKDAANTRYDFGTLPPVLHSKQSDKYILPAIEIVGADTPVPLGDIVVLSIKPIDKLPEGLKSSIYSWTILPPPPKVVPWVDSTRIMFGTGMKEQEYTVILTATYAFLTDSNVEHRTDTVVSTVVVGTAIKQAKLLNPPLNINELSQMIKRSLSLISDYDQVQKKADIKSLAESFRKVAAMADSKPDIQVGTLMTALSLSNADILKDRTGYYQNWSDFLAKEFEVYPQDVPARSTNYVTQLKTIASALDSY